MKSEAVRCRVSAAAQVPTREGDCRASAEPEGTEGIDSHTRCFEAAQVQDAILPTPVGASRGYFSHFCGLQPVLPLLTSDP